jgi:CheY-like chemotaxis protein
MANGIEAELVQPSGPLNGLRLLLVEDEPLVAIELEELIRELGGEVVGPFSRVDPALDALRREPISGAVLDVQLENETTFRLVDVLLDRGNPLLFVTGGAPGSIPEKYRQLPRLPKPFDYFQFAQVAKSIFRAA